MAAPASFRDLRCLKWSGGPNGCLLLLDQRLLPGKEHWVRCERAEEVAEAIRNMTVRGAPAIGIAAAYAMVLAARGKDPQALHDELAATRPTAVNLFWALQKCRELREKGGSPAELLALARRIHDEDIEGNLRMGEAAAKRIASGMGILTHCNAGALATGGVGTALGGIFLAHEQGKRIHVYVDETRPRLQGARLTTWELSRAGVPFTLICDNMAASLMAKAKIQFCVTGADRIAANGDTANKIGTYSVAVNARHHGIPFHVAAPRSTFDLAIMGGAGIPIEERDSGEVTDWGTGRTCAIGAKVHNPAFDVTPAELIRSIFTDRGEIDPVNPARVRTVLGV